MNSSDWARVFMGGLGGFIDSQNPNPGYVNDPTYNTAGGRAGQPQITSVQQVMQSPLVIGGIVVVALLTAAVVFRR